MKKLIILFSVVMFIFIFMAQLSATFIDIDTPIGSHEPYTIYGDGTGESYAESAMGEQCQTRLTIEIWDEWNNQKGTPGIDYDSGTNEAYSPGPVSTYYDVPVPERSTPWWHVYFKGWYDIEGVKSDIEERWSSQIDPDW
jgi:hypothetical protein